MLSASRVEAILKAIGQPPFPMNVNVVRGGDTAVVAVNSVQDIVDLASQCTRITIEPSGIVVFPLPIVGGRWHLPDTLKGKFPSS